MYLKRLEIQGFKSFADKTILEFMPGVTTVIGPNGSGKSNISDAIRWVLGEQSIKSLRGGKMEDIIFSGTSSRKPLNFAEVSLTIDNSDKQLSVDFSEITVLRRLYRTGESEYFINKAACRLKDIAELFMGTGIGKDGYSVIGQGRIDEILSSNSDERRNVFEEAAGISKYKARKIESEKKLESTEQNLIRINDILSELSSQLEPLKKQSEKALQFLDLREELKALEINNFIVSGEKLESSLLDVQNYINELNEELNLKQENAKDTLLKKDSIKALLTSTIDALDILKNSIFEEQSNIERFSSEIALLNEKSENNSQNILRINNEIDEFTARISELSSEKVEKEGKISYFEAQKKDYVKILSDKENEIAAILSSLSAEEQKIESIKSEISKNTDLISEKKINLNGITTMLSNSKFRKEQIARECNAVSLENDKLNMQAEDIKDKINSISKAIKENNAFLIDLTDKKTLINKEITEIKNKNYSLHSELNLKKSRHKFLIDTEKENEGYFKSVKSILDECDRNSEFHRGIHGTLAQLITVQENFELAIEASLGANLQNIITDTQEDAKKAIDLLKSNHAGRATFLPISVIKCQEDISSKFKNFPGYIGVASDLIDFNSVYSDIIKNLLGKTVIVDTLDSAISISKKVSGNFRLVSLEGDIVNTGGSLSGGSQKIKADSLLSRKRNISSLEYDIANLEKEILSNEETAEKLSSELKDLSNKYDSIGAFIKDNEILFAGENQKLSALENTMSTNKGKLQYLEIEKDEISEQEVNFSKEISIIESYIKELESQITSGRFKVDEYKSANKTQMEIRDNLNLDITDYKISISSFDESVASVAEILSRINSEIESSASSIEKRHASKDKLALEIESIKQKIIAIQAAITDSHQNLLNKQAELNILIEQKSDIENKLVDIDNRSGTDLEKINEVKEKLTKAELKKAKLDMDFDNISSKMWEDYQISYADALKLYKDLGNLNSNSKINSIKSKIKELGSINIDAIEEYKTLSERFEFMSVQKNDLDESAAKLRKIIADMTSSMKEEFIAKFNVINKNFGEVFAELFGGGQALIRLSDESNILESRIDIDVQPPGKKLQNMMLLSGGERAFTAIALLFAILKINPSPFCLLDEIEAALDDVNIYRFADYIKTFSDIQFIIITHRKGTMEIADSIYGVTMEERGISKLVSMKLN